ncbi:hypothetical protein GCM10009000_092410 [Halobacterium noricense]
MCAGFDDETYVESDVGDGTIYKYDELLGVPLEELPSLEDSKSSLTLRNYTDRLRRLSTEADALLVDHDADGLSILLRKFETGEADSVKDEGITHNTVRTYQTALRTFINATDSVDVDADDIEMYAPEDTSVDEQDVFDSEDVQALRDATDNPRNRAILEMLLNTGQRLTAIRTLKVGDMDVDNGVFYLNKEYSDGLKGADEDSRKRPLLGARGPVRDWLDYHPCRDRDDFEDAYLFTATTLSATDDYGEMMSESGIRYHLDKIHEKAGVDKPSNAHNYRHFFVTNAVKNWDLDKDAVKGLIGHGADSSVMETTYSHLTMDDYIEDAEIATDLREPDEDDPVVPAACTVCDYPLPDGAKACPKCGQAYTADAKSVQDDVEDSLYEGKGEAEDDEEEEAVDKLRRLLKENPELLDEL